MTSKELTLAAEDAEDLEIISARLQDAVAQVKNLVWLPRSRRFAGVFNRFKWEDAERRKGGDVRLRSRLYFDQVRSVKSHNLKRDAPDGIVSLLAIRYLPNGGEDPSGMIALLFAGGAAIRLDVEYIDAGLTDLSGEWAARGRPDHDKA